VDTCSLKSCDDAVYNIRSAFIHMGMYCICTNIIHKNVLNCAHDFDLLYSYKYVFIFIRKNVLNCAHDFDLLYSYKYVFIFLQIHRMLCTVPSLNHTMFTYMYIHKKMHCLIIQVLHTCIFIRNCMIKRLIQCTTFDELKEYIFV